MLIENPNAQYKLVSHAWSVITLMFWFLYIYLWLPLISLGAWWLGYSFFEQNMITIGGLVGFEKLIGLYLGVIIVLGSCLVLWAKLQQFRFQGKDKRKRNNVKNVSNQDLATYFNVPKTLIEQMQLSKIVTVHFGHEGNITKLKSESNPSLTNIDTLYKVPDSANEDELQMA